MVVSITYVSLILGELVPKRLALTQPEKIASIIAGPMQVLARIGRPVIYVLSLSTRHDSTAAGCSKGESDCRDDGGDQEC